MPRAKTSSTIPPNAAGWDFQLPLRRRICASSGPLPKAYFCQRQTRDIANCGGKLYAPPSEKLKQNVNLSIILARVLRIQSFHCRDCRDLRAPILDTKLAGLDAGEFSTAQWRYTSGQARRIAAAGTPDRPRKNKSSDGCTFGQWPRSEHSHESHEQEKVKAIARTRNMVDIVVLHGCSHSAGTHRSRPAAIDDRHLTSGFLVSSDELDAHPGRRCTRDQEHSRQKSCLSLASRSRKAGKRHTHPRQSKQQRPLICTPLQISRQARMKSPRRCKGSSNDGKSARSLPALQSTTATCLPVSLSRP